MASSRRPPGGVLGMFRVERPGEDRLVGRRGRRPGSPPIGARGRGTGSTPARATSPARRSACSSAAWTSAADLGAVGAIELPGGVDGALDQVGLDGVAGLELVDPGVEAALVGVGVLAGEDRQPGAAAVLDGVEPRTLLAGLGSRPGGPLGVAAVDLGARGRDLGGGRHDGMSPSRDVDRVTGGRERSMGIVWLAASQG